MFDISTITTEQREEWRALVAAHSGPVTRAYAPFASPFASLNALGSRIESVPVVMRDFVVQQGRGPMWAARPAPNQLLLNARLAQPVVERSALNFIARAYASAKQCGVDCLIGLFALFRAIAMRALGHKDEAWEMAGTHTLHISAFLTVGMTLGVSVGMVILVGC